MPLFLLKYWPEVLGSIIILAFAGWVALVFHERDHARAGLATCEENYKLAKETNDNLSAQIVKQNDAVEAFRKEAEARSSEAKIAIAAAQKKMQPVREKAASIAAVKITNDECTNLKNIIDEARK